MSQDLDAGEVARAHRVGIGRPGQAAAAGQSEGDLTPPQSTALARLDRGGPTTSAAGGLDALAVSEGLGGQGPHDVADIAVLGDGELLELTVDVALEAHVVPGDRLWFNCLSLDRHPLDSTPKRRRTTGVCVL